MADHAEDADLAVEGGSVDVEWVFAGGLGQLYLACEHEWENTDGLTIMRLAEGPAPKIKLTVTRIGGPVLVPVEVLEFIRTYVKDPAPHPRQGESIIEAIDVLLEAM